MRNRKLIRHLGVSAVLVGIPLLQASAQTSAPSPSPTTPPPATRPDPAPGPAPGAGQMNTPSNPTAMPPAKDKSAIAPGKVNSLVGLAVFSSDGNKVGTVQSVSSGTDGKVKAIHIKTGGFLGFGGKLVAIPAEKFTQSGNNVQVGMTHDEVTKLPEVKEQS